MSDDGALIAAIDAALAAQPDVLEKIRDGKVQAAGAIIGAVMKAMGGSADAGRVRELVLERAQGLAGRATSCWESKCTLVRIAESLAGSHALTSRSVQGQPCTRLAVTS